MTAEPDVTRPAIAAVAALDDDVRRGLYEFIRRSRRRVAREHGQHLGQVEREQTRPGRLGAERALTLAQSVLERHGFEPWRSTATCVRLHNCPFHPLAARAPDLVCGINQAFLSGFLDG